MAEHEIPDWVTPLLACPACRRPLAQDDDGSLTCACGSRFPVSPVALFADGQKDVDLWLNSAEFERRWARSRATAWIGDKMIAGLAPGATVLSVGEGYGELVLRLAQARPDVRFIASDLSVTRCEWAARAASQLGITNAWVCVADVARLPFADAAFAVGYARGLLHVVPRPIESVAELRRVVRERLLVDQLPNDPWGIIWFWLLQQWENVRARARGRRPDRRIFGELRATRRRGGTFWPLVAYRSWFLGARRLQLRASSVFIWETDRHHPLLGWLGYCGAIDVWF